jgi:hypothetical protein
MTTENIKPAWTQGGWNRNVKPITNYPTIYAGRNTHIAVIVTRGVPVEEAEANADLIAAAPSLYDALQGLVSLYEHDEGSCELPEYLAATAALRRACDETKKEDGT